MHLFKEIILCLVLIPLLVGSVFIYPLPPSFKYEAIQSTLREVDMYELSANLVSTQWLAHVKAVETQENSLFLSVIEKNHDTVISASWLQARSEELLALVLDEQVSLEAILQWKVDLRDIKTRYLKILEESDIKEHVSLLKSQIPEALTLETILGDQADQVVEVVQLVRQTIQSLVILKIVMIGISVLTVMVFFLVLPWQQAIRGLGISLTVSAMILLALLTVLRFTTRTKVGIVWILGDFPDGWQAIITMVALQWLEEWIRIWMISALGFLSLGIVILISSWFFIKTKDKS